MMEILRSLADDRSVSLEMNGLGKGVWNCFSIVVSAPFSCDIFEWKDMSCVRHGIAVSRPCLSCLVATDDISDL